MSFYEQALWKQRGGKLPLKQEETPSTPRLRGGGGRPHRDYISSHSSASDLTACFIFLTVYFASCVFIYSSMQCHYPQPMSRYFAKLCQNETEGKTQTSLLITVSAKSLCVSVWTRGLHPSGLGEAELVQMHGHLIFFLFPKHWQCPECPVVSITEWLCVWMGQCGWELLCKRASSSD